MSLGRYGADNSAERKVSLEITVDKWVSDALGKIRAKGSVSSMVNGFLGTVVKHYDPGPLAPMIYEFVSVLAKYRQQAEAEGDIGKLASVVQLHSVLEPYIDLAEVEPEPVARALKDAQGETRRGYSWYAVPVLHCGAPMAFLRGSGGWKCLACGFQLHDA